MLMISPFFLAGCTQRLCSNDGDSGSTAQRQLECAGSRAVAVRPVCSERPAHARTVDQSLSQSEAQSLALVFALRHRLVPEPVCAHATREDSTGNWNVLFEWCYQLPDGTKVPRRVWTHLGRIITVAPDGYCHGEGADSRTDTGACATRTALPEGVIDEKSATLVARAFALAGGLVPTDTAVESTLCADGSWLVSLVPGTRLPQHSSPGVEVSPVVIRVDQGRECKLVYGRRGAAPTTQATAQAVGRPGTDSR